MHLAPLNEHHSCASVDSPSSFYDLDLTLTGTPPRNPSFFPSGHRLYSSQQITLLLLSRLRHRVSNYEYCDGTVCAYPQIGVLDNNRHPYVVYPRWHRNVHSPPFLFSALLQVGRRRDYLSSSPPSVLCFSGTSSFLISLIL